MEQVLTTEFFIGRAVECLARAEQAGNDLSELMRAQELIGLELIARQSRGALIGGAQLDMWGGEHTAAGEETADDIGSPAAVALAAARAECVHGFKMNGETCADCEASQRERVARHRATHCEHDVPNELSCLQCQRVGIAL